MTEVADQAGKILAALSGSATTWALDLGLRLGLFEALGARAQGATPEEVAVELRLDEKYTAVLLRSAYAAEVLDCDGERYVLADHMGTLLLNSDSPAYVGGAVATFTALRETFLELRDVASSGRRVWWNDYSPEWVDAVGENGQTYYRRMIDRVVPELPDVRKALENGARVLDAACGVCRGPAKIAEAFPQSRITAVDADDYTLSAAAREMSERGLEGRFDFVHTFLEDLDIQGGHQLAIINISLHEARDIERATANLHRALQPGGTLIVSEFPFPDDPAALRTVPGRLMCGVQAFEAHIGCQLLPTSRFVDLLENAGFRDVTPIPLTATHVVIHGRKP